MRWFRVRKADIKQYYRDHFEELGLEIVRAYFTQPIGTLVWRDAKEGDFTVGNLREFMQPWLREQYDRAERKESWLMTMEIAITILVAAELVMSVLDFYCRHRGVVWSLNFIPLPILLLSHGDVVNDKELG